MFKKSIASIVSAAVLVAGPGHLSLTAVAQTMTRGPVTGISVTPTIGTGLNSPLPGAFSVNSSMLSPVSLTAPSLLAAPSAAVTVQAAKPIALAATPVLAAAVEVYPDEDIYLHDFPHRWNDTAIAWTRQAVKTLPERGHPMRRSLLSDFIQMTPRSDPLGQSTRLDGSPYYMTLLAGARYTAVWTWVKDAKVIRVQALIAGDAIGWGYDSVRSSIFNAYGIILAKHVWTDEAMRTLWESGDRLTANANEYEFVAKTRSHAPFAQSKRLEDSRYYLTSLADRQYTAIWEFNFEKQIILVRAILPADLMDSSFEQVRIGASGFTKGQVEL